jgi:hypothetical protein
MVPGLDEERAECPSLSPGANGADTERRAGRLRLNPRRQRISRQSCDARDGKEEFAPVILNPMIRHDQVSNDISRWERTVLDGGSFNALPTVAVHAHEQIEFDEAIP